VPIQEMSIAAKTKVVPVGPVPSVACLTTRAKTAVIKTARILENANGFMEMEFHMRNGKHPLKLESVIPKVMIIVVGLDIMNVRILKSAG